MKRARLTVENRSDWPECIIKPVCRWVFKLSGIDHDYQIIIKNCRANTWHGTGGRSSQQVKLDVMYPYRRKRRWWYEPKPGGKRFWPYEVKDHRFKWSASHHIKNRLELLVFLLAHEAYHATGGHPAHWREGGRINRDSMEYRCNDFGMKAVERFRAEFAAIKDQIRTLAAKNRQRHQRKKDPLAQIEKRALKAQMMLKDWQRKRRLAENKVKRWQKAVKYYQSRRQTAACTLVIGDPSLRR